MMFVGRLIKRFVYQNVPGFAGAYPYYGVKVRFPKRAAAIDAACFEGTYEKHNIQLILRLLSEGTHYFDVGANLGLMSIPVLRLRSNCHVVSFEPSPYTLSYLQRTAEGSGLASRWKVIGKAVGNYIGHTDFHAGPAESAWMDGIRRSHAPGTAAKVVAVPITTLDAEWDILGRPIVSVIKLDIEGGEVHALQGAIQLIQACRPFILTEWWADYLASYNETAEAIFGLTTAWDYSILGLPGFLRVVNPFWLRLQEMAGSYLLLAPSELINACSSGVKSQ